MYFVSIKLITIYCIIQGTLCFFILYYNIIIIILFIGNQSYNLLHIVSIFL